MTKRGGANPIIIGIVVIAGLIIFGKSGSKAESKSVSINGTAVTVDVAETSQEQEKGLGGRGDLDSDAGMLFVYGKPVQPSFWMKGMHFPIDIIWIKDGKVVGMEEKVPAPGDYYLESGLPKYKPSEAIDRVLEVNAGWAKEHKVKKGDTVQYSL